MPRVAVVIPCYNTSAACVDVITKAHAVTDAVLVVDDGSTDDTAKHIKKSLARCIRLPVNSGKGAALEAGIQEVLKGEDGILGHRVDYIVTLDGDGQHDPADVPRFVGRAQAVGADLVIGVRDVRRMPPKSKAGNYASRVVFLLGTRRYVADTQSGFRLFSLPLARKLMGSVRWRRFETEAEILFKTVAHDYKVTAIDIATIYFDGNRRTHFDPVWDSMRVMAALSRGAAISLVIAAVDFMAFVALLRPGFDNLVAVNVAAQTLAAAVELLLTREYVFRVRGKFRADAFVRYVLSRLANVALTTWLLLAIYRRGNDPLVAKVVAQLAGLLASMLIIDPFIVTWTAITHVRVGGEEDAPLMGEG